MKLIKRRDLIITIGIQCLSQYHFGELICFFEMSCAISAYNLGVNPFDQPGEEAYKSEMGRLIEEL